MPSQEEIQFSKDRYRLQEIISTSFQTLELCLGLQLASAAASLDSVTGALRGDTLADQVMIISREYWRGNFGDKTRIEVAIGHNGVWRPVVTVTPHDGPPVTVVFENNFEKRKELLGLIVAAAKQGLQQ